MKAILLFIACGFSIAWSAPNSVQESWIAALPAAMASAKRERIPAMDAFEVVTSKFEHAVFDLKKNPLVAISPERARWYTGPYYSCPKDKRPFLVRGVVGHSGTGSFHIYKVGSAVLVSHESIGDEVISTPSALVVNLSFEPTAAYAVVDIAQ